MAYKGADMRPAKFNTGFRRIRGFTLIELSIVVVVMIILATIAAPAVSDFVLRSRVRGAADALVDQLALVRTQSMRMDRNVSYFVVSDGATAWCAGARQYTLPGGSIEGYTLVDGLADKCDCSDSGDVVNCAVAGDRSVVDSGDYSGVEMSVGDGTALQFDRKLGVLSDLTGATLSVRSASKPTQYQINVVIGPMGHAKACIPDGFVNFGGYKSC